MCSGWSKRPAQGLSLLEDLMTLQELDTIKHNGDIILRGREFTCSDEAGALLIRSGAAKDPAPVVIRMQEEPKVKEVVAPSKSLDKMNRTELEDYATTLSLGDFEQYDSKAKLIEAINKLVVA